jgi:hypothetical protein
VEVLTLTGLLEQPTEVMVETLEQQTANWLVVLAALV